MATVVTVTSGKGGVGKTTSSAAIAAGLAQSGKRTVVIDFDVGLRNLDLIMGVERRVVFDFVNVIQREATLNQALIQDKRLDNLSILAASQTKDKDALTEEGVADVESIDKLLEASGFKMGPFKLMDLIGVETNFSVTESMYNLFYQDSKFRPSRIQKQKVDAGHHGRKSGKGFYTYA